MSRIVSSFIAVITFSIRILKGFIRNFSVNKTSEMVNIVVSIIFS